MSMVAGFFYGMDISLVRGVSCMDMRIFEGLRQGVGQDLFFGIIIPSQLRMDCHE